MALKFQYNKTALQQLKKQLKIRENALPTLQAKESALRFEVKSAKDEVKAAEESFAQRKKDLEAVSRLWPEFPVTLLSVGDVSLEFKKIAGVKTPLFKNVSFSVAEFSLVSSPSWLPGGLMMLKQAAELQAKIAVAKKKVEILEYARKKTTQKVNLYEKVQIPEYQDAILKIKRFMEDDENLAKSSQKILKARIAAAEAEAVA
jgi:V/A-type H+-transporting ATPase subunit D